MNQKVKSAPFRLWLLEEYPDATIIDISQEIGLNERTVRAVLKAERPTIGIEMVDRALTNVGSPYILDELYPLEEAA